MKWILNVIWNPVEALDLHDKDGLPDHGKLIGFLTYITILSVLLLYVLNLGKLLPLGHTIALISTAYGWAGWRAFLSSKAATSREQIEHIERAEQRHEVVEYPYGPPTYDRPRR